MRCGVNIITFDDALPRIDPYIYIHSNEERGNNSEEKYFCHVGSLWAGRMRDDDRDKSRYD